MYNYKESLCVILYNKRINNENKRRRMCTMKTKKINLSLLKRLNNLAGKTIPNYFSSEENPMLYNARKVTSKVGEINITNENEKKWEELRRFALVEYIGEFYERYKEKGIVFDENEMTTMILYFSILKNNDGLAKELFNDYQISEFETFALEHMGKLNDNPYLDFSMYLLTNDESYLEKMCKNVESVNDLSIIVHLLRISDNIEEVAMVLANCEFVLTNKSLYSIESNFVAIRLLLKAIDKMDEKKLPEMFKFLIKATMGKANTNGFIKKLKKYDMDEVFISETNALLSYSFGKVGDLKKQNLMINTLINVLNKESEFSEEDKYFIDKALSIGKLTVRMNSGTCENIRDIIRYYNMIENVVNSKNYIYFANKCLNKKLVDILDDCFRKIEVLSEKYSYKERIDGIEDNTLLFFVVNSNIVRTKDKEEVVAIINKVEKDFGIKYKEMFYEKNLVANYQHYAAKVALSILYSFEIHDPLVDYKNGLVSKDLLKEFYKNCISNQKYEFIKYIIEETNKNPWLFFERNAYLDKCYASDKLPIFKKNELSNERKKELMFLLLNALVQHFDDKEYYRNCFLNFIRDKEVIANIFNEEEIQELYHVALEIVDVFQTEEGSRYYGAYRYYESKSELKKSLDVLYMSEEEKEKIRLKKEEEERIKKEKERQEEIARIKRVIEEKLNSYLTDYSFISTYKKISLIEELDWNAKKSMTAKKWMAKILTESKKITVSVDNLPTLYKNIGTLVGKQLISIEDSSKVISNIKIVECDLVKKKELVA